MADLDRLLREQNPEPGQPRVPVPQYQKVDGLGFERVTGRHGGAHSVLLGPDGRPISSDNRLPVDTGLSGNLQIIADNQGRLYGRTASGSWLPVRVNSSGQLELAQNVVIDNVTVNVGAEVKVNNNESEPVPVQLSGTKVIQREITISTIPGGQVQTNIITPDSPSRLVGVFSNIRTEGNPTTGHLQMDVYVGDGSMNFLNRIARLRGDAIVSLRKILTIYPAGLESGTEVTLPSGVSNINDYLSHCSKFSFSPNAPLVVEISNTTDQPVSNPQLRRLVVWYTSI